MGNDDKITEEQKSNQIHKEVMLFLGKELERIHQTSNEQTYDIQKEYAKSKKNHSPFSALMLIGCFVVVFAIAFLMTRIISSNNEEITVSVEEFDDLNLKNLLNTVGAAQTNYDNAVKERAAIEADMSVKLKAAEDAHKNDLFVIDSMNLRSKKKKNDLVVEADAKYKKALAEVHEEYDAKLVQAEAEVEQYKKQLAEFDTAKVQAAQEKEKALDSERRVKEMEQQKIKDQYENRIAELNKKLADTQKRSSEDMRSAVSSVSLQYQSEIALLDPKLTDEAAEQIISSTQESEKPDFDGSSLLAEREIYEDSDSAKKVFEAISKYQIIYDDYKYLDSSVAAVPQKNSIPSYVAASHSLVNEMGETFVDTAVSLYNENQELTGKIDNLNSELAESRRQLTEQAEKAAEQAARQAEQAALQTAAQKEFYEESYEVLLPLAKTNAILISASDYDNLPVYVVGKARYLITDAGADAEFKADNKTIKGKIFRAEDGSFYFVVGEDKNGNRFEVNLETIIPGTSVKILSK